MIEVNLLKEGHGILYEKKKSSNLKYCSLIFCFLVISILSLSVYGILFYDREELNTLLYIIDNDERFVLLSNLIPKKEYIQHTLDTEKTPGDEVEEEEVIDAFEPEVVDEIKVVKKIVAEDKTKSEKIKTAPEPVLSGGGFEVIAGTCVLRSSAEHIAGKLKKLGFNSSIKNTESNVAMYAVWIGEFEGVDRVNAIKQKLGSIAKLLVIDSNGKYIIRTESVLFSKRADNILKKIKGLGSGGRILKTKERRKTFTVLIDTFDTIKEAKQLKANVKSRDRKIPILIAEVKTEK